MNRTILLSSRLAGIHASQTWRRYNLARSFAALYKNYYKIMGLNPQATDEEIRVSFKKLTKLYHPDVNPSETDKYKEILEAYHVLSDEARKGEYDRSTSSGKFASSSHSNPTKPSPEQEDHLLKWARKTYMKEEEPFVPPHVGFIYQR